MYVAKDFKDQILIEFTRRYTMALHIFRVNGGFAPSLIGCEELPGGLFGVAMKFIKPSCCVLESSHLRECGSKWIEKMKNMVNKIHEKGYVHGIVDEDKKHLMLIEFNWGGGVGKASFPGYNRSCLVIII